MTANPSRWLAIGTAAAAAIAVAGLGASVTDLGPWYQGLKQPAWKPPDVLFGPAWTIIYALIAIAGVVAWERAQDRATREWVIGLFALNGFLNILWSVLFFRVKRPDGALVEVVVFWLSIVLMIFYCRRFAPRASLLLLPYLAWVTFAGLLNWAVVALNP